jgi:hypothetical protein
MFRGLTIAVLWAAKARAAYDLWRTSGNRHARRLLVEAAWHYRHPPRRPTAAPDPSARAWQAQIRLAHRHHHLTQQGKRSTVATTAVARELAAFLWAEMTDQPPRQETLAA